MRAPGRCRGRRAGLHQADGAVRRRRCRRRRGRRRGPGRGADRSEPLATRSRRRAGPIVEAPDEPERVVIRDNRKIDPVTGEARKPRRPPSRRSRRRPGAAGRRRGQVLQHGRGARCSRSAPPTCSGCRPSTPTTASAPSASGSPPASSPSGGSLAELLPVVDDLDRARAHGDLTGPLKAVADKLEAAFAKLGLVALRRGRRPVRPRHARGGAARRERRGHRADVHDGDAAGLPARRAAAAPGHGRRRPTRSYSPRSPLRTQPAAGDPDAATRSPNTAHRRHEQRRRRMGRRPMTGEPAARTAMRCRIAVDATTDKHTQPAAEPTSRRVR